MCQIIKQGVKTSIFRDNLHVQSLLPGGFRHLLAEHGDDRRIGQRGIADALHIMARGLRTAEQYRIDLMIGQHLLHHAAVSVRAAHTVGVNGLNLAMMFAQKFGQFLAALFGAEKNQPFGQAGLLVAFDQPLL